MQFQELSWHKTKGAFEMTNERKTKLSVQYLTRIAILTALSSILFLIEIPFVAFYKIDLSNLPVIIGTFSMGMGPGLIILALKSLIGMLHSSSMYVGELSDFLMGAAYIIPAAIIYKRHKTRKGALAAVLAGTVAMTIVAIFVNWKIMIPFYVTVMHIPLESVLGMANVDSLVKLLLTVTVPFNLIKGALLSILTFLLYKHLSPLLHVKK